MSFCAGASNTWQKDLPRASSPDRQGEEAIFCFGRLCHLLGDVAYLQGARFGTNKISVRKMWRGQPYGVSVPYIRNTMTRDAYIFMRQHIHFADNSTRKEKVRLDTMHCSKSVILWKR